MSSQIKNIFPVILLLSMLTACAQVGSERWCQKMQETPQTDWSINESSDYTRHCLFK